MFWAGIWVIAAPRAFYAHTPGLNIESVYDTHLLRDIGLIFLAFGVGLLAAFRVAFWTGCRLIFGWGFSGTFHRIVVMC